MDTGSREAPHQAAISAVARFHRGRRTLADRLMPSPLLTSSHEDRPIQAWTRVFSFEVEPGFLPIRRSRHLSPGSCRAFLPPGAVLSAHDENPCVWATIEAGFVFVVKVGNAFDLERFRAKWIPVRVKKTRQIKSLESFTVSMKRWKTLAGAKTAARRPPTSCWPSVPVMQHVCAIGPLNGETEAVIPPNPTRKRPHAWLRPCCRRNLIERTFRRFKDFRRVAMR